MIKRLLLFISIFISSCVNIPENVSPVIGFDIDRYLGTWYEIARLDHSFERGLERVTAEYRYRDDGGIKVLNRGFDPKKKEKFPDTPVIAITGWGAYPGAFAIESQADKVLSKPFELSELDKAIKELISSKKHKIQD